MNTVLFKLFYVDFHTRLHMVFYKRVTLEKILMIPIDFNKNCLEFFVLRIQLKQNINYRFILIFL